MKLFLKSAAGLGAAGAFVTIGSAAQAQSADLQANGGWDLQQAAESCSLVRNFGDGTRQLQLRFDSFGHETPYHIVLTGDGLPLRDPRAWPLEIGFGGQEEAETTLGLIGKPGRKPMILIEGFTNRSDHSLGWLYYRTLMNRGVGIDPSAETLYIDMVDSDPMLFPLGPMEEEYRRLDDCADAIADRFALEASDGVQPATQAQLIDPKQWNWRTKYPEVLLVNRVSGMVQIRMKIDEKGRAKDCVVQTTVWAKTFGEDACANFEKWRKFEPAKDAAGAPMPGFYRTSISYSIYNW